jgi:hypothetical protein
MSTTKINLESIDWNNLSVDAFQELHAKLEVQPKERKLRTENNRNVNVKILDKHYTIPYQLAVRLKNMKSQKSKEKLQITIMENYKPIISI